MANSKTSLNGYEYGRNPKTTAPFWGESGEGAEIDDDVITGDKTWSSVKIHNELIKKADKTELVSYAKVTSVYTKGESYSKAEVDDLLAEIPSVDAYTKTEVNTLLANKADKSDTYTKSQVNNLIPDVSGLATKTELNSGLAAKANSDDVYSKSQTYTKTEVDNLIADIPAVDAYTKTQTDTLLADKANVSDLANYVKTTSVYTKSQTYTKTEVDDLISGIPSPDMSNYYTKSQTYSKTETDSKITEQLYGDDNWGRDDYKAQNLVIINPQGTYPDILAIDRNDGTQTSVTSIASTKDLANKANVSDVYTKSQTYTKTEVDNLISGGGGGDQVYTYTVSNTSDTYKTIILAAANAFRLAVGGQDACKLKEIVCKTKYYFNSRDYVTKYRYKVVNSKAVYSHSSPTDPAVNISFMAEASKYNNEAGMGQSNFCIDVYANGVNPEDSFSYFKKNTFSEDSDTNVVSNWTQDYSTSTLGNGPWAISDTGRDKTWEIEFVYG